MRDRGYCVAYKIRHIVHAGICTEINGCTGYNTGVDDWLIVQSSGLLSRSSRSIAARAGVVAPPVSAASLGADHYKLLLNA
jgi:hypothetical protein